MFVFQTAYALSNLYQSVFGDKEKALQVIITDNDLDDHRSVFFVFESYISRTPLKNFYSSILLVNIYTVYIQTCVKQSVLENGQVSA